MGSRTARSKVFGAGGDGIEVLVWMGVLGGDATQLRV